MRMMHFTAVDNNKVIILKSINKDKFGKFNLQRGITLCKIIEKL